MNELLGTLLPILLSGGNVMDVLKALTRAGVNTSYDGLSYIQNRQVQAFLNNNHLVPSDSTIRSGAEAFLDSALGINPFSQQGQMAAKLIQGAYGFAPGIIGGMIGVPNPQQFFQQMVGGATGIWQASGRGLPNMLNPYQMYDARAFALRGAQTVFGLSTNGGQGFNVDFTSGLNMNEVGMVSQRLLSSRLPYVDKEGGIINPDKDADKFKENLRRLGTKFNEAASMLSKITGSVEESLALMDRMSGSGNFLGGTEEDAMRIANRARKMAAAARITSAMAGMDPREFWQRMGSTENGIFYQFGVDADIGRTSGGLSALTMDQAYMAQISYNAWAAQNPKATQQQKNEMLYGINTRVQSYMNSGGERMAALVSRYRKMFSQDEIKQIEAAFMSGRPNDVVGLVSGRLGDENFQNMMSNDAIIMSSRENGDKETYNRLAAAAYEGNMYEAQVEGARSNLDSAFSKVDEDIIKASGKSENLYKRREEAGKGALVDYLVRKHHMSREQASKLTRDKLMSIAQNTYGDNMDEVERVVHRGEIASMMDELSSRTMSEDEERRATARFYDYIVKSGESDESAGAILTMFDKSQDKRAFLDRYAEDHGMKGDEKKDFLQKITGGRIFGMTAASGLDLLNDQMNNWQGANFDERMKSLESSIGVKDIFNQGVLPSVVSSKEFKNARNDTDRMGKYDLEVSNLAEAGLVNDRTPDGTNYMVTAAKIIAKNILGSRLGDMAASDEEYRELSDMMAHGMVSMDGTDTVVAEDLAKGAQKALKKWADYQKNRDAVGKEGMKQIEEWLKDPSRLSALGANADELAGRSTTVLYENSRDLHGGFVDALKDAVENGRSVDVVGMMGKLSKAGYVDGKGVDGAGMMRVGIEEYLSGLVPGARGDGIDFKDIAGKVNLESGNISEAIAKQLEADGHGDIAEKVRMDEGALKDITNNALSKFGVNAYHTDKATGMDAARDAAAALAVGMGITSTQNMGIVNVDAITDAASADVASAYINAADKDAANKGQNALANALNFGSGAAAEAISEARSKIDDLREKIAKSGGFKRKDFEAAFGKGGDAGKYSDSEVRRAQKKARELFGADEETLNLVSSFYDAKFTVKGNDGKSEDVSGADVLFDKNGRFKGRNMVDIGSGDQIADVIRKANSGNMDGAGGLIELVANFIKKLSFVNDGLKVSVAQ